MRRRGLLHLLFCLILIAALVPTYGYSSDPVTTFIISADSIATAADEAALSLYMSENELLVGAAIGQLIDTAIEAGDGGQKDAEAENLALAKRLAALYRDQSGSDAILALVAVYRDWGESERAIRRAARELERQSKEAQQTGDHLRAIELLNQARTLFESIGDLRSVAVIWGSLGVAYWYTGDFEGVMRQYEHALEARRAIGDRILEGKTLNGMGSAHYQLGNYAAAFDFYTQAIDLRRRTGDLDGLGTSLTYLGNTYLALGRVIDARVAFEQALPLIEQSGRTAKHYEILTSVASLNAECGRMMSSNSALRRALELARSLDDPIKQLVCHNNLALNLADAYQYHAALEELGAAEALLEQTPDPEQSVVFHRNRGIALMKMGELSAARDDLLTLLKLSREHKMPQFELEALINLGYLLKELGAFEQGLKYAGDAQSLAGQLLNPNMIREAAMLSAELERYLGRSDLALERWRLLLEQDTGAGNETDCIIDRMGIANVLVVSGREDEARLVFREVRAPIAALNRGDLTLVLEFGMGHSFERSNPDSARYYYERALAFLGKTRQQIENPEQTGYLSGLRRYYYEEVARFYAQQSFAGRDPAWSKRAFATIERAKARGLLDLMKNSLCARISPAEEALLDSLYQTAPVDEKKKEDFKKRYEMLKADRIESAISQLEARETIADPEAICRLLPRGTAFLSYALGDTLSLLWIMDRNGFETIGLPNRRTLRASVEKLRDAMARPGIGDDALKQTAHELYTALLAPAEQRLKEAHELVISPDGVLFELPFEVLLISQAPDKSSWKELPYLARAFAITYIPSASIYLALHESAKNKTYGKELLAFGDPDYSLLRADAGARSEWRRLPHTRREVLSIGASLKDNERAVYTGGEANEAELKKSLHGGSFRVLHLATHGLVDPADPAASTIVLCPDPESTEDGYLHTMELLSMKMDIDLAVLSACESARGQIGRGEGVVGLSRALLASGVQGVVASLWAVSDESTAFLMDTFYREMLGSKQPAHNALNDARFALMNDERFSHPYYWSPFIVIGLERTPW